MCGRKHQSARYGEPHLQVVRGNEDAGQQQCKTQRHSVDERRWRSSAVRTVGGEHADRCRQKNEHPVPVVLTERPEHAERQERCRQRQRQAVDQAGDRDTDGCAVQRFAVPFDRY